MIPAVNYLHHRLGKNRCWSEKEMTPTFWVMSPGPPGVAHRSGHQPHGQLHLRAGQQRGPADHGEPAGAHRGRAAHALPGAGHRVRRGQAGGADHAGVGQRRRRVLQRRALHRRDGREEDQPHPAGVDGRRDRPPGGRPVRVRLQERRQLRLLPDRRRLRQGRQAQRPVFAWWCPPTGPCTWPTWATSASAPSTATSLRSNSAELLRSGLPGGLRSCTYSTSTARTSTP